MKAITLVDMRLQLARALDRIVSPGSDLPFPGWPWRWPDDGRVVEPTPESSAFVREWVAAGRRRPARSGPRRRST